jgi:hypothetical protein
MLGCMLGPRSVGLCLVLAKHVDQIERVSGVVVMVELLREQWRELFCVADVLADSAPLDGYDVGPGVCTVNLPVLSVIVSAPKLPRPPKCLLLACADLDLEWRQ